MSTRPNSATVSATIDSAPSQVADVVLATAMPPASVISAATDEASAPVRQPMSLTTTLAPSAANRRACSRPIPPPAPVTMATLPSSLPMVPPRSGPPRTGDQHTTTGLAPPHGGARRWCGAAEAAAANGSVPGRGGGVVTAMGVDQLGHPLGRTLLDRVAEIRGRDADGVGGQPELLAGEGPQLRVTLQRRTGISSGGAARGALGPGHVGDHRGADADGSEGEAGA